MVVSCCAYGCNEIFVKGGPITFHLFPKDVSRRQLWETQLKRENFKASDTTKICSKHFEEACFDRTRFGGTWLKPDAIPTRFDFPNHLVKKKIQRNPKERMCVNEASVSQAQDSISVKGIKRKSFLGDFDEKDMASPTKARKVLSLAKEKSKSYNKKIKNLKKMTCRLKRKIGSLTEMLNELREKRLISDSASSVLELSLPGSAKELLDRIAQGNNREKYSPQLRAFALTLNFYSVKAYEYVRKTFNCNLPHSATLRKWYQSIDGSPGLTSEAFIASKAEDASYE